jgi:HD-like signal output (HDOD) protein
METLPSYPHAFLVRVDMKDMVATMEKKSNCRAKALKTLGDLPPFSPVLNRLLADLGRDDVSFGKLADLIEKDTVIAGNVLHVVNSALYGRRGTINSVRSAVSVLGLNKLRNFVLSMSVARLWNQAALPKRFNTARFNRHAVATAIMSDLLAQHLPIPYPEGAFVAGLFHDLGKMLIAVGMKSDWEEVDALYQRGSRTLVECEEMVLGVNHAELSGAAVAAWSLPAPIQAAVYNHHQPEPLAEGSQISLSRAVAAADHHANNNGCSVDPQIRDVDLQGQYTLASLGLSDRLDSVIQQYEAELEAIAGFFR